MPSLAGCPASHHIRHLTLLSLGLPPHLLPHHRIAGSGPCSISQAGWHWAAAQGRRICCTVYEPSTPLHPQPKQVALTFSSSAFKEKVMLAVLSNGALEKRDAVRHNAQPSVRPQDTQQPSLLCKFTSSLRCCNLNPVFTAL